MGKVFRIHSTGASNKDWFSSNPIGSSIIDEILAQDKKGTKQPTSIPSPFARMDLVRTAFGKIANSGNIDGDSDNHKLVSDALDMVSDFDVDLIYDGDAYSSCSFGVDLDVFVSNAAGFDINDPWATFNGTNYAATGDCPEEFGMDMAAWGDGEYIIWHELWDNVNAGLWEDKPVNITTTFVRAGVFTKTIVQDDTQAMNSNDLGEAQGGTNTHGFIAKVVIADGKFTISDYNGDEVISGKLPSNKVKSTRPAYLNNNKPEKSSKLNLLNN